MPSAISDCVNDKGTTPDTEIDGDAIAVHRVAVTGVRVGVRSFVRAIAIIL